MLTNIIMPPVCKYTLQYRRKQVRKGTQQTIGSAENGKLLSFIFHTSLFFFYFKKRNTYVLVIIVKCEFALWHGLTNCVLQRSHAASSHLDFPSSTQKCRPLHRGACGWKAHRYSSGLRGCRTNGALPEWGQAIWVTQEARWAGGWEVGGGGWRDDSETVFKNSPQRHVCAASPALR